MRQPITADLLRSMAQTASQKGTTHDLMERAVTTNGIFATSENNMLSATNTTVFSHEVDTGSVTDQKESGRCWLFATLNALRHQMITDHKLESLELSQSYSFFWDKLEKSNMFYELIIDSVEETLSGRKLSYLIEHPQVDGGWWEYSAAVITKYGVVPKSVMPESVATSKSRQLNILLDRKLRKDALELRRLANGSGSQDELQSRKEQMLAEVYDILTIAIGTPPQSFDFAYRDKDKNYHRDDGITPQEFLKKYGRGKIDDYVSVLNDPSPDKSYGKTYAFKDGGNMVGGPAPLFLNVDMPTLKKLVRKQLEAGEAVWFGCDIGTDTTKKGYMTADAYDFDATFSVDFGLSKAERLASRDSSVTHAVSITGVDIVQDQPRQWKVENSWGEKVGNKGYYTMSDGWFDANGYVVAIRRDLLDPEHRKALAQTPETIPIWDPLNG